MTERTADTRFLQSAKFFKRGNVRAGSTTSVLSSDDWVLFSVIEPAADNIWPNHFEHDIIVHDEKWAFVGIYIPCGDHKVCLTTLSRGKN